MKNIMFIGFDVPGYGELYKGYSSQASLLDSDIIVFSPSFYYETSVTQYQGKIQYTERSSQKVQQDTEHWKREFQYFLDAGKNIFIFLSSFEDFVVYTGNSDFSGTGKSRTTINYVTEYNNYKFLSVPNVHIIPAIGTKIRFNNNHIFKNFYEDFKDLLSYNVYLDIKDADIIFETYTGKKILGCYKNVSKGNLIFLPFIDFDDEKFTTTYEKEEEILWTKEALVYGKKLVNNLLKIDKELFQVSGKTPEPDWLSSENYLLKQEIEIRKQIQKKNNQLVKLNNDLNDLFERLEIEKEIKSLLYESGKPLENAVINALIILGYSAENYNDGSLELDQVILSPEGLRYIGECEGKDNYAIDISKFRQLSDSINEDFEREEVDKEAFGLLFGNPFRFIPLENRKEAFTKKCIEGAKRRNIGLIRTSDLFTVCQYLKNNNSEEFKTKCRQSIHDGLGGIITFPSIPK